MYFFGFLAAVIILLLIIVSPYIMKFIFKIKSLKGIGSGMCCVTCCLICLLICSGLWAFLVIRHMKKLGYSNFSINFSFTFSEWFLDPSGRGFSIEYYYLAVYLLLDILVFILIICFVRKGLVGMESKNQILMFISGFNFAFILFFTLSMFIGLQMIGNGQNYDQLYKDIGYHSLLLCFEFFVLSYLFQLSGVILLVFLWLRKSKKLYLFIALVSLFAPFIFLYISLLVKIRVMTDLLTPLTYYIALVFGIIFFAKEEDDNISQQINLIGPS